MVDFTNKGYIFILWVKNGPYYNPWTERTHQTGEILRTWASDNPPWYQPRYVPDPFSNGRLLINEVTMEDIPHPWIGDYPEIPPELECVLVDPTSVTRGSIMRQLHIQAFQNKRDFADELFDYEVDDDHIVDRKYTDNAPPHCIIKGIKRRRQ